MKIRGDVPVTTYASPEMAKSIDEAAARSGLSRAAWIRMQIAAILEQVQEAR
jgi:hypothetical protein